jgi:Zn-dependent peptidase ImmA (M78 family)
MPAEEARHFLAASRARKLLEQFGIVRPAQICLEDIAWALGLEVMIGPLKGAEAHLVRVGESGAITVSDSIPEEGRQRFAIAHELGHWLLHREVSQAFLCTATDMRDYRASGPELEANTFASELLIPKFMVDPNLLTAEPEFATIRKIRDEFNVTLTAAAVRYVGITRQPVIVIFSDGEQVKWMRRNESGSMGDLWMDSKQPLSEDSCAYHEARQGGTHETWVQVPWDAWFPNTPYCGDEVFEFAVKLYPYDTVMSLLWLPTRY